MGAPKLYKLHDKLVPCSCTASERFSYALSGGTKVEADAGACATYTQASTYYSRLLRSHSATQDNRSRFHQSGTPGTAK
eukprot:scaffold71120_cov90-Phaeocystis_antarctica.AAC.1